MERVAEEGRALDRACATLRAEKFVEDSDLERSFDGESVAGLPRGEYVRSWFHRCCTLRSYLVSGVA